MKKLFTLLLFTAAVSMAYAQQPASNNNTDDDVIFSVVENEPEYPGGEKALYNYIIKNVKYPKSALEKGIEGTVIVEFVVEKNGKISKELQKDLDAIRKANIPRDIIYIQGADVLDL